MKRFILAASVLLISFTLSAQGGYGGGRGGYGGHGGGYGGRGMQDPQSLGYVVDPFSDIRDAYAERKTKEYTDKLGLDAKQAKKVLRVYRHPDPYIADELAKKRTEGGYGNGQGHGGQGGHRPEGGYGQGGQRPEGGQGHGGYGQGGQRPEGGRGYGRGGGQRRPREIPVSEGEQKWREKKMARILTPEQYNKWVAIEAERALRMQQMRQGSRQRNGQGADAHQ